MIILFKRMMKSAWENVFRNAGLSLAAIFVIFITLIFATSIFIVKDFGELIIKDVEDKINVSVYFKDGVDEDTILEIKQEISEINETRSVDYFSKSETFDIFIERYKDNPVIMASLAEVGNPFLASLSIKSESQEGYEVIVSYLNESPSRIFFEKIDYDERKDVISGIFNLISLVRKIGFIVFLILSFIAILIIFNVVRLTIYGMKDEIKIMRLVGVSCSYIRGLFVLEGAIIGFLSFIIAFLFIFIFGLFFGEKINNLIPSLDIFSYLKDNFSFILFVQLLIGIILGVFSSLISVSRHFKY